jgi:hypothetical protein
MAKLGAALGVVVVAGAAAGGFVWYQGYSRVAAGIEKEVKPMVAEIPRCEARLKSLHAAWARYRRQHRGQEPPNVEALLAGYVKSPTHLMCPTAERFKKANRPVDRGTIKWRGEDHWVTYGFAWLSASNAVAMKRSGEDARLVVCTVHREVVARYVYHKEPVGFALGPGELQRLKKAGADGRLLAVSRKGTVSWVNEE